MVADITDAEVEAVARAMCASLGRDPDELVLSSPSRVAPDRCTRWQLIAGIARDHIAAYRAIEAFRQSDAGPVTVWVQYSNDWTPSEFPTLKEALLSGKVDRYARITRNVDFDPMEKAP